MSLSSRAFVEVTLGPFGSAEEACIYCFSSFTKKGDPPAGPVAPFCVCMAYPDGGEHKMFCATPPSAPSTWQRRMVAVARRRTWRPWGKPHARKSLRAGYFNKLDEVSPRMFKHNLLPCASCKEL